MKDLAAVAPLLLVAGVFVGVCIAALRATDWRRVVDRRPATATHASGVPDATPADEASATSAPAAGAPGPEAEAVDAPEAGTPATGSDAEPGDHPAEGSAGGRHRGPTSAG